ncbi:MAG: GntR family transcriptional regulator [Carbonactinosporaceae bacterium]
MHETLRRVILSGELAGGTRLVQADLAKQLGVSTTPVREALRDLATEGLIRLDPHRGAIVRELKLDEVREIYELRKLLEPVSIRRAVERITTAQLDRAAELSAALEAQDEPGRWVELNRAFHAVFASASDSPRLEAILEGLRDGAAVYIGLSIKIRPRQMTSGNADHRALLKAVRRRDADAAVRIQVRHLESTMRAIEAATQHVVAAGRSAG